MIFLKCSKPKPKLSRMFIGFIKNCLDDKNYIMKLILMGLCMLCANKCIFAKLEVALLMLSSLVQLGRVS